MAWKKDRPYYIPSIGAKFGEWLVVAHSDRKVGSNRYVFCRCRCGVIKEKQIRELKKADVIGCRACTKKGWQTKPNDERFVVRRPKMNRTSGCEIDGYGSNFRAMWKIKR